MNTVTILALLVLVGHASSFGFFPAFPEIPAPLPPVQVNTGPIFVPTAPAVVAPTPAPVGGGSVWVPPSNTLPPWSAPTPPPWVAPVIPTNQGGAGGAGGVVAPGQFQPAAAPRVFRCPAVNPCHILSECYVTNYQIMCKCPFGLSGPRCKTVDPAEPRPYNPYNQYDFNRVDPCSSGGYCEVYNRHSRCHEDRFSSHGYYCECPNPYHYGKNCEYTYPIDHVFSTLPITRGVGSAMALNCQSYQPIGRAVGYHECTCNMFSPPSDVSRVGFLCEKVVVGPGAPTWYNPPAQPPVQLTPIAPVAPVVTPAPVAAPTPAVAPQCNNQGHYDTTVNRCVCLPNTGFGGLFCFDRV